MKIHKKSNIVLIGMPGCGKSTVGVILAKRLLLDFVDTDVLIQTAQNRSLQDIVDADGYIALREIEEKILLRLDCLNHVVATGGSAVYSGPAMEHLKLNGLVIFLDVEQSVLELRIRDFGARGLAKRPDQSFADLFQERLPLYRRYADITLKSSDLSQEEVCDAVIDGLNKNF